MLKIKKNYFNIFLNKTTLKYNYYHIYKHPFNNTRQKPHCHYPL